jgi:RNA polymerase sigma-70 factor (ECF subfamily)
LTLARRASTSHFVGVSSALGFFFSGFFPKEPARSSRAGVATRESLDSTTPVDAATKALVARIRAGDADAFRTLFDAHYHELVAHAYAYVGRNAIAEEVVQDAFLSVWNRRNRLAEDLRPLAYLYTAVRNTSLKLVRRDILDTKARDRGLTHEATAPTSETPSALDNDENERLLIALDSAIAKLPPRLRDVVELRWRRQLRVADVAAVLGLSPKSVETYVTRAVASLRELLSEKK